MGQGERRVRSSVNPIIQIDSSQSANLCSAPLPFVIFIVVVINKHYLLSMEDLLIDCCFSADQNKGWIN